MVINIGASSKVATLSAGKLYFRDDTAKTNDDAGAKTWWGKNLDGSEDMSFTGQSGVKAYPEGEYSAETGYLENTDTR